MRAFLWAPLRYGSYARYGWPVTARGRAVIGLYARYVSYGKKRVRVEVTEDTDLGDRTRSPSGNLSFARRGPPRRGVFAAPGRGSVHYLGVHFGVFCDTYCLEFRNHQLLARQIRQIKQLLTSHPAPSDDTN